MKELIEEIKKAQSLRGLSDTQMAKEMRVDLSTLSKIKNGKASPGGKFLRALASTYPELRLAVYNYMSGGRGVNAAV